MAGPDVVHVLPDKLGGVFSFAGNLLQHRRPGGLPHGAVLRYNVHQRDSRADEPLPADWQRTVVDRLPRENLYAALRRLRRAVAGPGALVAHDWLELAMASAYRLDRAVFAIMHGDFDYYYDLAVRHEPDVDVYVTYTEAMYARLCELLPHRRDTIMLRRYGVRIAGRRTPAAGPLRLLFVGRLHRDKGIFDLPEVDAVLRRAGANVTWTLQGTGPDEAELRRVWTRTDIRWTGRQDAEQVLREYERHDVLVMPSRNEGLPVALLEAGAAGVVPVVSDLRSGIPEIVRNGESGWRVPVGDSDACARAILAIAADRDGLERMSAEIQRIVSGSWNITGRAAEYQDLFERWRDFYRPGRRARRPPYGSRLDQRWLPNVLVKAIRGAARRD